MKFFSDKNFFFQKFDNKFLAFFSKNGGVSKGSFYSLNCSFNKQDHRENVIKNRKIVCKKLNVPIESLVLLNQIHSNKVIEINQQNKRMLFSADAMITKVGDIVLGIMTADCAPIVFIGNKFVGIAHVGWKGLVNGIIDKTVELLKINGEKIQNLRCIVGPHLSSSYFEVKHDFISNLKKLKNESENFIKIKKKKLYFDFSGLIFETIKSNNIQHYFNLDIDTYSNPKTFFSYRYSKNKSLECGRQLSIVSIKKSK